MSILTDGIERRPVESSIQRAHVHRVPPIRPLRDAGREMRDLGAIFNHPVALRGVPFAQRLGDHCGGGQHSVHHAEQPVLRGAGQPIDIQIGRSVENPVGAHWLDQIVEQRLIDQHEIEFGEAGPP
jgi:hypothetical protein